MDLNTIYDYMTGRPDTYKGLKGVGYEDFEKNMGDARYRRNIYNQLYINGGINSKYDAFDSSWQKTYGVDRDSSHSSGMTGSSNENSIKPIEDNEISDFFAALPKQKVDDYVPSFDPMQKSLDKYDAEQQLLKDLKAEGLTPESLSVLVDEGMEAADAGYEREANALKAEIEKKHQERRASRNIGVYDSNPYASLGRSINENISLSQSLEQMDYAMASELYKKARNILDASFKGSGFFRGVKDAGSDVDNFTFGLNELGRDQRIKRVTEKWEENGKDISKLTDSEQQLLNAATVNVLSGVLAQESLPSTWYNIGKGVTKLVPSFDPMQKSLDKYDAEQQLLKDLKAEGLTPESLSVLVDEGMEAADAGYEREANALKAEIEKKHQERRASRNIGVYDSNPYASLGRSINENISLSQSLEQMDYAMASELYKKARNILDASFKGSGFFRGVKDAGSDVDNFTFGLNELGRDQRIKRVTEKWEENGKDISKLTDSEQQLLNAATVNVLSGVLAQESLPSTWYNIGKGVTKLAPYMLQFALTYGAVSPLTRGLARSVMRKLGGNYAARLAGMTAEGMATAALQVPLNATNIAADTQRRMMGDVQAGVDRLGNPVFKGLEGGEDFLPAVGKSVLANYITNLSEMSGVVLLDMGRVIRYMPNSVRRAFGKITDNRYIKAVRESDFVKWAGKAGRPFKIGNAPEEMFEEYVEGTLNALTVGDTDLDSLYSWRSFKEIAGVVLLTLAAMGGLGMVQNNRFKGRLVREYGKAEESFGRAVPDKEERDLIASYINLEMGKAEGATPFDVLVKRAAEQVVNRHADDFMQEDGRFNTEAAEKYRNEVSKAIAGYFTLRPLYDAYLSGITGRKKQEEERIREEITGKATGNSGKIITAILQDGRRARVTSENVVLKEDGTLDVEKTGDHFTVVYEDDGTAVQLPADDSYRLEVVGVEDAVQAAVDANNEMIVREEEEAVYGPRPQVGELVYVRDSEGNPVALAVGSEVDERGNFTAIATRDYDDKVKDFPVMVNMSEIVRDMENQGEAVANEGGSEPGKRESQRSKETPLIEQRGNLAMLGRTSETEFDEDGSPFIISSTGTTVFGEIREETGLRPAPIKLSLGNSKYGLIHLEKRHGEQIRQAGFASVEEFVEFVSNNYKRIKRGENSVGEPNGTYLLQIEDDHNNTLYVELSTDGAYWGVNSGGVFRKGYGDNKKEVWSASEEQSKQSVAGSTLREEDNSDNPTTPNGNVPDTSIKKKKGVLDNTTDTVKTLSSNENDTATPGNAFSTPKGNELSEKKQGISGENVLDEYQNFVDNGTVPDDVVSRIANKMVNGETLTPEEESMRQGASDRVEESLRKIKESQSTLSRIPKDEKGDPVYEQTDSDTAWDAIVEQTEGDEIMAQTVADGMVADKEAALKKLEKAKSKGGVSIAEKIAAEKERKAEIDVAKQELAIWQKIAGTANRRKMEAEAERRRIADEVEALRKAEEERLRAGREEAERIEREALNGVPDMVDDKPTDARARGYRRMNGHKIDRQQPLEAVKGKGVQVRFSDSDIADGRVAVIDASRLQPSHVQGVRNPLHFIDEAQPKERNDEASVMSSRKIAANMRPEEITTSVTAYTGAPTVNSRGEVIQGNNRSDALKQMWDEHKEQSAAYKQYLIDHAEEFGLNPADIDAMERPVLVNMLDVDDKKAIELGQFVAQDTESGGMERIKPKNAVQKMGNDMRTFANLLLASGDEEISFAGLIDNNGAEVLKWMNSKGYITPTQYQSAFDTKGNLTAEAKNDLRGIMYQSIFKGGSTRLEEMFNTMPARAQKAILATAYRDYDSPSAERLIEEVQNSIRAFYALMQTGEFANAKNIKEARMAVEAWKRQYRIDDATGESYLPADNFSNFALHLAAMYRGESQSLIQSTFNKLYDLIQGTQEANLFEQPDNTPRTLAQAIKETLNIDYNGQQRSNVLVGDSTASQDRQGGSGTSETGERVEGGNGTADGTGGVDAKSTAGSETVHQPQPERKGSEQNTDERREADSSRVADDTARKVLGIGNRGDIRVFEEGLASEYNDNSEHSERTRREAESERLVSIAKKNGLFIPSKDTHILGEKFPKRTGESVVYIDRPSGKVYKVKDPYAKSAMKSGVQPEDAIYEHTVHNLLFPETEYTFEGISEELGDVRIILSQNFIETFGRPTPEQIAEALAARGLYPEDNYSFGNELVSVSDIEGENVLLGEDGTVYFIDPIIRFKKPVKEIISALSTPKSDLQASIETAESETNANPAVQEEDDTLYRGEAKSPVQATGENGREESPMQREVRAFGERMAERLGGGIRFVYSREIPESEAGYGKKREAYGYYDTETGDVVVVLDNHTRKGIPSVIEVAKTVMHEVVGHKGVRGLLGHEGDSFLDGVYRGMKARSKAELESKYGGQLTRRVGESETDFESRRRRLIADEYIAQIAEQGNNPGLLRRVIAKIREVLRGLGVDLAMTDNDIREILRRSARELTRGKNAELNVENDIRYRDSARKEYQLEVINRYNPMLDDVHTGIRSVEDIQSFEEMYEQAKKDYEEYGDMVYPDMDMNMLENALETGYIRVYSSNRISPGAFVTPSRMNAEDYSGGGDVYSEMVPVNDVAWIDQSEGQYTGGEIRYREGIKNPPEENTQPPGTIASQPMDVAKVRKEEEKRQTAKKNLLGLGKSFRERKSGIGVISDIAKAIGARGNGASKYAYFTLPDNTIFSVRISNHNANAETYKERGNEKGVNTSIVIKTRRKGNRFKSSPGVNLSEFVYMREDIAQSDGDVLSQIAESLADMMETGYYEDKTGLARINISGSDDIRYRAAYHGSPADFERFDHSFMGTGEGAQAYGWGTYVTEVNGIARSYAENLSGRDYVRKINRLANHVESQKDFIKTRKRDIKRNEDYEKYAKTIRRNLRDSQKEYKAAERVGNEKDMEFYQSLIRISEQQLLPGHHKHLIDSFWEDINNAQADIDRSNAEMAELNKKLKELEGNRHLYMVEIPDDTGNNYLNWGEKPAAGQLFMVADEAEKEGLANLFYKSNNGDLIYNGSAKDGKWLYEELKRELGSDKAASKFLSRAGFTGIKYPAEATTGGRADGAKNYVIFDERDLEITDHIRFREKVNERFNEELSGLTEENAQSKILYLGYPSDILLSTGIPNRRIALYGNKLIKKSKQHGYSVNDVKDLPNYVSDPVAVFNGSYKDGFAILTEMPINGKNALVSVDVRKGEVQDLNLITSVFDKNSKGILDWINNNKLLYADKEKALNYLSSSAPIADATSNQELLSATNIVKSFENPKIESENAGEDSSSASGLARNDMEKNDVRYRTAEADYGGVREEAEVEYESALDTPMDFSVADMMPVEAAQNAEATRILRDMVGRFPDTKIAITDISRIFAAADVERMEGENVRYRHTGLRFDEKGVPHYDTDIHGRPAESLGEGIRRGAERAAISLFDEQLKLKQLQNRVTEWLTGDKRGDLAGGLRFYDAENQAGSIAKDRKMRFDNEYKSRLFELRMDVYKTLGNKVDDKYYYYAKTLHERTGVIGEKEMAANRAAMFSHLLSEQHPGHVLPEGFFDPKIYPYEALQDYARKEGWIDSIEAYIADCEGRIGKELTEGIWNVIGDISAFELTTSFKSGLITRDHYDILMYGRKLSDIVKENLEAGRITDAQYNAFLSLDLTAEELHKAGFLTDEQFKGLERRYAYYLPLKGDSEPTSEDTEHYEERRSRVSFQIKSVKGGNTRLVNDPISRLLADVYASISYQEKMAWMQSMYQALRLADRKGKGVGDFAILDNWVVKDEAGNYVPYSRNVEGTLVFTPTEGEIASGDVVKVDNLPVGTDIRIPEAVRAEHLVRVKHRGRNIVLYFRDPGIATAVNNHFVPRKTSGWIKLTRPVTQFLSKVMTQWNVFFTLRNLYKDFGEAAVNNYTQYGISYLGNYTKNYMLVTRHGLTTLRGANRTLDPKTPYEKMVEEFFKYGGEVSYTQMESYEKTLKDFEKELHRSADKNGILRIGEKGFRKIGEAISSMNKIVELNARLATFITSRERGYGLRQSIRDAKEVTVNFDRRGGSSRGVGSYFLFWNAGRQSNRRKWELMRENPGRFWTARAAMGLLNIAQTYVMGAALSTLFGVDWDDYMTAYYDIPDYMRYNNIVLLSPDGNVYRIPLSPAFAPYKTLVENVGEAAYRGVFNDKDGKYDLAKGVGDVLKSLSADLGDPTNWNAKDFGQKMTGWAPAPVVPFLEAIFNVDFTGRPIYKEGNLTTPGYKKAYQRTDQIYVDISEWLNEATGGEAAYGSGIGRLSNPGVMEHVVEGFLGGLIQIGTKFYNIPGSVKEGSYERLPFVDTFYYGDSEMLGEREVRNDIYEAREVVKAYNDTRRNFVKTDEDIENNPRTSSYLDRNESKIDDLKDLLKLYDEITEELKDEDSEEYRERLKMLRRDIVELTNELEEY